MSIALNKPKLDNLANEIWKSAERLRGKFKAYEYQNVILPLIVLRRLECVLVQWRKATTEQLYKTYPAKSDDELAALSKGLEKNPKKSSFSNDTAWTLEAIYHENPTLYETHFREYLNGFSANVQAIIDHFNYRAVVGQIVKNNRLGPLLSQYKDLALGPDVLSNLEMGYVYEELLRRFSEQSGEEAGEHFTPREVIRLMVELLEIPIPDRSLSIYDPACGTGGMLSVAKEHLLDRAQNDDERTRVENNVSTFGQELQPGNFAICLADLLIKKETQSQVYLGNSLIPHSPTSPEPGDQLAGPDHRFDFMLSNPPFGVTWGGKDGYETEARKYQGEGKRYEAGMPRVTDGALLFLQTMLAKAKPAAQGGSRIAIIFNGSPLSNGDCGSGESEIRRWILERDWLDAIVMLPDQLFYNTGIFTYIWLLNTAKPTAHNGRVALIDARRQFEKEPKAFGNKRNRITDAHRAWIEDKYRRAFDPGFADPQVKVFATTDFAYHKVSVVFHQFDEHDKPAVVTEAYTKDLTAANLRKELEFYNCPLKLFELKSGLGELAYQIELKPGDLVAAVMKAAATKLRESLEPGMVEGFTWTASKVTFTHPLYVADDEYIPFQAGKDKNQYIPEFLAREIGKPIVRWEDSPQLGYEILPNKEFYVYQEPEPADALLKKFWELEKQAEELLKKLGDGE